MAEKLKDKFNDEELKIRATSDEKITVKLTNNYAFQKIFKNTKIVKGFLMALLDLKEYEIKKIEITDPFTLGKNNEEKEGILDIKLILNQNRKINIEMQNTYQDDWTERSLFYNCRMFTDGFQKGHPYGELPPCIHVGILSFNQMISPNYYHKISLMDEKTKEIYSRKFQFHMLELKKLENVKEKQKRKPLYQWAKLIAAQTWEELEQESKGNKYMERALEEMIKISQDEKERYLYLREEMAESDRVSQIQSAQRIGHEKGRVEGKKEGEILKLISLAQKKILKNKTLSQIADELEEDVITIEPIYKLITENPDKTKEEIYKMLEL
ncbi:PD-(D/E)XK nuclease family transposase [uncultured Eubacterium sp.]|jgi:predicted transposase/invertase (TIGR01784 family)|nr:Rpn family recombination-promoting nuclease/putative transposase [uncultured Anaerostipes sp.]SCJ44893.1 PD-(D/E)XK nuclease family transposase [uncultured Eubacterium sp.]